MSEITGVLLAAGSSRRFGSNKLLSVINGMPIIEHAAASLSPCDNLLAVVRSDDISLQQLLAERSIEFAINDQADHGLGSSIACAVEASREADGWCLLPADMPFIKPQTTSEVVDALKLGHAIVAPHYRTQRGHPVGFSSQMANELHALDGTTGARQVITDNQHRLLKIETQDEGILIDIDTPEDLLLQSIKSSLVC